MAVPVPVCEWMRVRTERGEITPLPGALTETPWSAAWWATDAPPPTLRYASRSASFAARSSRALWFCQ